MDNREFRERFLAEVKRRFCLDPIEVDEKFIDSAQADGYEPEAAAYEFGVKYDLTDMEDLR